MLQIAVSENFFYYISDHNKLFSYFDALVNDMASIFVIKTKFWFFTHVLSIFINYTINSTEY